MTNEQMLCQGCGTAENVCIVEKRKNGYLVNMHLCKNCYEKSMGKNMIDTLNWEPMFISREPLYETQYLELR